MLFNYEILPADQTLILMNFSTICSQTIVVKFCIISVAALELDNSVT